LEGFTDADGAMQEHRQEISGHIILIEGGAVSWCSKKQELVTLSTTKAEYIAAIHTAKELIWFQCFLKKSSNHLNAPLFFIWITSPLSHSLICKGNSMPEQNTSILGGTSSTTWLKMAIELVYCPTKNMTTDLLTKPLPNTKVKHFVQALGLLSI